MTNNARNTSPLETKAEFARRLGVNRSTVTRGVQQGRILVNGKGLVLINESLARWEATKAGRYDVEARHAANRGHKLGLNALDTLLTADDDLDADGAETGEITALKAAELSARNKKARIEIKINNGELILKDDHAYECARFGNQFKQAIQQTVDILVPVLSGANQGMAEAQIQKQIDDLIERLA